MSDLINDEIKHELLFIRDTLEDVIGINFYMSNGNSISFDFREDASLEISDTSCTYTHIVRDGCSIRYYVSYENVSYISVIYGCPKVLEDD